MTNFELDSKVRNLRELKRLVSDATELIDNLQNEIKAEMTAQIGRWKAVTQTKLDTTALNSRRL